MSEIIPDAGELIRRIKLRLWTDVPNAAFGLDLTVDPGIDRWAKVEPIYGIAIRAGMNVGEVPTHLFWIRYGPDTQPEDITESHVIEWRGRRYRILDAINVANADRFTRISAKDLGAIA